VFAAALPERVVYDVIATWPSQLGLPLAPQSIVVAVTSERLQIFDIARPPNCIADTEWANVQSIEVARYVTKGRWFSGIAFYFAPERKALVVQVQSTQGSPLNYLREKDLAALTDQLRLLSPIGPVLGS